MKRKLWSAFLCLVFGHVSRWSPDDADDHCRRCGKEL